MISTLFADDINIIMTNTRTHQGIPNNVEKFAKSCNLHLKPTKCKSPAIGAGDSHVAQFNLSGLHISSIVLSSETFLVSHIIFSGKQIFELFNQGLATTLDNIDNYLARNEYKLKVYTQYVLPAVCFTMTGNNQSQI